MSAFLVSDATMQEAVEAVLIGEDNSWNDTFTYSASAVGSLGRELFALNQRALAERYGDNAEPPDFIGAACLVRRASFTAREMVYRFKSLRCLVYQCSEGDVPESDLYKRIDAASDALARKIVEASKEYEIAKWGH